MGESPPTPSPHSSAENSKYKNKTLPSWANWVSDVKQPARALAFPEGQSSFCSLCGRGVAAKLKTTGQELLCRAAWRPSGLEAHPSQASKQVQQRPRSHCRLHTLLSNKAEAKAREGCGFLQHPSFLTFPHLSISMAKTTVHPAKGTWGLTGRRPPGVTPQLTVSAVIDKPVHGLHLVFFKTQQKGLSTCFWAYLQFTGWLVHALQ